MATRKPVADAAPLPTREQWATYCDQQVAANPTWVPPEQLCLEDIQAWQVAKERLRSAQASEILLRQMVFRWFFPIPGEGTNNAKLPDGTLIVGKHVINRKVEEEKLAVLKGYRVSDMRSYLEQIGISTAAWPDDMPVTTAMGISVDKLVEFKPSLVTSEYRTLTAEQALIFETALDIKPGSPQLEVTPPKEPK